MSRIRVHAWIAVGAFLVFGCSNEPNGDGAPAGEADEETVAEAVDTQEATPAAEVASYAVPDLSAELGRQLVASLGEQPGVVSARVDEEKGLFLVTFRPGQTDPATMLSQLQTVAAGATLTEVGAAAAGKDEKGCGGCPSKSKCPKARAATSS